MASESSGVDRVGRGRVLNKSVPFVCPLCLDFELASIKGDRFIFLILRAAYLPDPPDARHREMLSDAMLNMRISKALLALAVAASPVTMPV